MVYFIYMYINIYIYIYIKYYIYIYYTYVKFIYSLAYKDDKIIKRFIRKIYKQIVMIKNNDKHFRLFRKVKFIMQI